MGGIQMNQSTMEAYAEVDTVLNLMDKKYLEEIPVKLRELFSKEKSKEYIKEIVSNKPLKEQNLKEETLSILAVLNYNYWCKDEVHKKELLELYSENERKFQDELREKYNPDNIFKKHIQENKIEESTVKEEVALVENKESIFKKFINKIKSIFNIK